MCFCTYSMCGWQGFDKVKIGSKWTDFKKVIDFHEEIFTYDLEHNRLYFYDVSSMCKQTSPCCLLIFDLVRPGFPASTLLGLSLSAWAPALPSRLLLDLWFPCLLTTTSVRTPSCLLSGLPILFQVCCWLAVSVNGELHCGTALL